MSLQHFIEKSKLATAKPTDTLKACAAQMKEAEVGAIVIVENQKPVGMITDRDLVLRAMAEGRNLEEAVSEIMTTPPVTISSDANLQDLIEIMEEKEVRRVVVEKDGQATGIVSSGDIETLLAEQFSRVVSGTCPKEGKLKKKKAA